MANTPFTKLVFSSVLFMSKVEIWCQRKKEIYSSLLAFDFICFHGLATCKGFKKWSGLGYGL